MMDVMPYNFIPLGKGKTAVSPHDPDDPTLLEGRLRCTLTVDSPVFIPNTTGDAFFSPTEQKVREFYSRDVFTKKPEITDTPPEQPLIPGSSIRGVLRSVYEAATNSCMSVLGDKYILSTRQPFARQPGILKKTRNGYQLYNAIRYGTDQAGNKEQSGVRYISNPETHQHFHTGDAVRFQTTMVDNHLMVDMATLEPDDPNDRNCLHGIVLAGEPNPNKQSDAVFVLQEGTQRAVCNEDIELLKSVLALYADKKRNKHMTGSRGHTGYKGYSLALAEKEGLPVYIMALNDGNIFRCYLSPAAISKNVYRKTLNLLTEALGYAPCTGKADEDGRPGLCPACSLFGTVGKNGRAYGSRVRITDALPKSGTEIRFGGFRTIAPQMEPNVSATEMYTLPPEAYASAPGDHKGWTFDYVTRDGTNLIPLSEREPMLRGRKFYWHFAAQTFCENSRYDAHGNLVITKRFTPQIRPLIQGTFEFDIYLDGVTEEELEWLIALIRLPNEKGFTGRHKIGAAKALGYGTVKMDVERVEIRTLKKQNGVVSYTMDDRTDKYKGLTCFSGEYAVFAMENRDDLKSLRAMLNAESLNHDEIAVHYLPLSAYKENRNVMGKLVIKNAYLLPTALGVMVLIGLAEQQRAAQQQAEQPDAIETQYTEEQLTSRPEGDELEQCLKHLASTKNRKR